MEGDEVLGSWGILKECIKVMSKTGKIIIAVTMMSMCLDSLLLFIFSHTIIDDSLMLQDTLPSLSNMDSANSFEKIMKEVQIIIGFEFINLLPPLAGQLFVLLIIMLAITIFKSKLSCEKFLSRIPKLFLQTLATWFNQTLLTIGYIGLHSAFLISLTKAPMDHVLILLPIFITYGLFAFTFWMNFAFICDIGLVIFVIEKGVRLDQAPEKFRRPVDGNILVLALKFSFVLCLVTLIVCMFARGSENQKEAWKQVIQTSFATVCSGMAFGVLAMSCSVLFECKEAHGEESESQGNLGV